MKTDRELLELAAKAAFPDCARLGYPLDWVRDCVGDWNPLTDDGDALRLAVFLKMRVWTDGTGVVAEATAIPAAYELAINNGGNIYVATRHAIVSAAAAIGEQTK